MAAVEPISVGSGPGAPREDETMLVGRRAEHATVERLLGRCQDGHCGVLVVRGEAGIGKTALLAHMRDTAVAAGFRVEEVAGVEAEAEFAYAGLHQLCAPLLARVAPLPEPQQAALGVALGMRGGAAPDRFLVGLAVLSLLAEVAEDGPLLCVVDDAQWLDQASAQVLAFVARRVVAERMVLVFALRDTGDGDASAFAGLPDLRLVGLSVSDAQALLAAAVRAPLDDVVRDRIVAEARGNPLALLELGARPAQPAGGFELPDLHVPRQVEEEFRRRSGSLPADTQSLLLVAAAEPTGEPLLLWRATAHLHIAREAAEPAEAAGLLVIDTRVRFRHPLVRSAVYRAAPAPDLRRAHAALATATDPRVDPDRRAWHRAQSVLGTDEDAAAELERSAGRARARGGLAAAAAFLQRAAELTPEPADRARRALEAAHVHHETGAPEAALALLAVARAGPLDALQRARLQLLQAQIAFHLTRGSDAPALLLDAARTLAPMDPKLSRETYLHALDVASVVGGRGSRLRARDVAESARAAPPPPGPPDPTDLLLDGLVTTYTRGYEAGVPGLRRALEAFRAHEPSAMASADSHHRRWLPLASVTALALFDDELVHVLADRNVALAREAGALATLSAALLIQSATLRLTGDLAHAAVLVAEQAVIRRAIGGVPMPHAQLQLAAWSGDEATTTELHAAGLAGKTAHGDATAVSQGDLALAVLHNGLGNYAAALEGAARARESDVLAIASHAGPELIEAAARSGRPERAAAALEELDARAGVIGSSWALGMAARSRALMSTGRVAEENHREALARLRQCRMAIHLARAHLVYGEWLRREGRRQDARDELRIAHEMLSEMGAKAFAARAARELQATGEHPRTRSAQPSDVLTAQELRIARLVATGATSREAGAQLFLSPRTIEAHLRSIFRKLGISSRRQLRDARLP